MLLRKIGDVAKVNIDGVITNCIIVSEAHEDRILLNPNEKYLVINYRGFGCYEISSCNRHFHVGSGYYTLVGDQKIYVENREFYE